MLLASIEDVSGSSLDLEYDGAGRLVMIQQRLERRALRLDWHGNQITGVSLQKAGGEKDQILARYEYDPHGRLVVAYNALGYADHYEYDTDSRMNREILKDGGVFRFIYDNKGRCVKTSALDRYDEKSLRFFDDIHWTEVTDSLGNATQYECLSSGQVLCEVSPLGAKKITEYDAFGRIISTLDANGANTRYEYDSSGNRSKITNASGESVTISFNDAHLPIQIVDPIGNTWIRRYDDAFRLTEMVNPLNHRWAFHYSSDGRVISITDPNGNSKRFTFSSDYSVLVVSDWGGNQTEYRYDASGNVFEFQDPLGGVTKIRYDLLSCPLEITFPDLTCITWSYDSAVNLKSVIDAAGSKTSYRFGPCRRLLEKVDPVGNSIHYHWGTEPGRLEKVTNAAGESYDLYRDSEQRIVRERGFDGTELWFEYDAAGHCIACINAQQEKTTFKRNLLGRLIERILPDNSSTTFDYDCWGNIAAAKSGDCEIQFIRDALGRIVEEQQAGVRIFRTYDGLDRCVSIKTDLGCDATYSFNATGGLSALNVRDRCTLDFFRNSLDLETRRIFQKRLTLEQRFDSVGLVATQQLIASGSLDLNRASARSGADFQLASARLGRRYGYDKKGRLQRFENSDGRVCNYLYDGLGRIVQVTDNLSSGETFTFDKLSNVLSAVSDGVEDSFDFSRGGRLEKQSGVRYEYDENGRQIKKESTGKQHDQQLWEFRWDAINQLVSAQTPDSGVWHYEYDPFGRRISKRGAGKKIRYVWDRDVILQTVENDSVSSTWFFEPSSFKPLCTIQKGTVWLVITDHLGVPRDIVDESGEILWSGRFSLWGQAKTIKVNGIECGFRFPGQVFDAETQLSYNRFRYYDAKCGRYISKDPVGLAGGLNLYRYVLDPVNSADPFALIDPWDISFSHPLPQDPSLTFTDPASPWCGKTVCDAIAEARQTGQLPPGLSIEAQEVNGKLVAVNNRTLWVAQQANLNDVDVHDEGGDTFHKLQRNFRDSGLGGPVDPEDMTGPECGKK